MDLDVKTYRKIIFNDLIYNIQDAKTRFVMNYGGAGSGKSFTQAQHEVLSAFEKKEIILVIRKFGTTLADSVVRLVNSIIQDFELSAHVNENKSSRTHYFDNGSEIIFKGLDDPEKIKSIHGVTRVWIEEASELSFEDFKQLNLRLRGRENLQMTLTFNPIDTEHWINKHFFLTPEIAEKTTFIKTTYKDNRFIDDAYKLELESYKTIDENYYRIYVKGDWGLASKGRIFPIWETIDTFPEIDGWWLGLDFGYSSDPCAIVKFLPVNDRIYLHEVCYQKELLNSDIARIIKQSGYSGQPVVCDSAEPKSIAELRLLGINAIPADKGPGSVNHGIDYLKSKKILVTSQSKNIQRENMFYCWKIRKDGEIVNVPEDRFNHAIDAIRYAAGLNRSRIGLQKKSTFDY
jgi:phage terminase large subunit